jgi:hypothetical protein
MHMFEWPSIDFLKQKVCEKLVLNLFWKIWIFRVQHLDYCSHCLFVASPKCWYCSASHILHIQSSKSIQNQIPCKSTRWTQGERSLRVFPGMSGFLGYSGPGLEIPGYKGINTFLPQSTGPIHPFYSLTAPSPSPSPPSLPHLALGDFHFPPSKSSESERLRAPRCGDRRSTKDSKDWSLSLCLPKVSL